MHKFEQVLKKCAELRKNLIPGTEYLFEKLVVKQHELLDILIKFDKLYVTT